MVVGPSLVDGGNRFCFFGKENGVLITIAVKPIRVGLFHRPSQAGRKEVLGKHYCGRKAQLAQAQTRPCCRTSHSEERFRRLRGLLHGEACVPCGKPCKFRLPVLFRQSCNESHTRWTGSYDICDEAGLTRIPVFGPGTVRSISDTGIPAATVVGRKERRT
jgi:hypothetical protein